MINRRFAAEDRQAEYREWYRRTLFEKRVNAAQDAYEWVTKLNVAITSANPAAPESDGSRALVRTAQAAREWYDRNTVFLHEGLPSSSPFIGLTNMAVTYANGHENVPIWEAFGKVVIWLGIHADKLLDTEHQTEGKTG
jgi:hypothetical protein